MSKTFVGKVDLNLLVKADTMDQALEAIKEYLATIVSEEPTKSNRVNVANKDLKVIGESTAVLNMGNYEAYNYVK